MKSTIKKIIQEEIKNVFENKEKNIGTKQLKNKIDFLSDFTIKKSGNNYGYFYYEQNGNKYYVEIKKDGKEWFLNGTIDGKLDANDSGTFNIGPIQDFDEFIFQVNNAMNNNPLLSPFNLHDKLLRAVDKEIGIYLEKVIENKNEIKKLPEGDLEDVKDIIKVIESNTNLSQDKLIDRLREDFRTDNTLLNVLRKVDQLGFYKDLNKYYR